MKYNKDDSFTLSSGREFYANHGIIGLTEERDRGRLYPPSEGYDGGIGNDFTAKERAEIAMYMIHLWATYLKEECHD